MSRRKHDEAFHDDDTSAIQKGKKKNIIAFIFCILIAFIIWIYASNVDNKNNNTESSDTSSVRTAYLTCQSF